MSQAVTTKQPKFNKNKNTNNTTAGNGKKKAKKLAKQPTPYITQSAKYVKTMFRTKHNMTTRSSKMNLAAYLRCLRDPFNATIGKLGFGTFIPTSVHSGWFTKTYTPVATSTAFVIGMPTTFGVTSGFYADALLGNVIINGGISDNPGVNNATTLALLADAGRVICAGMRVTVKYPASSRPGRAGGIFISHASGASLTTSSYNTLTNLSGFRDFYSDSAGFLGGQVNYLPSDMNDFNFYAANVIGASTSAFQNYSVVVGVNWPAGQFTVDVSYYLAEETIGGVDLSAEDDISPAALTADEVQNAAGRFPEAVLPSISIVEMLDAAVNNISRARGRYRVAGSRLGDSHEATSSPGLAEVSLPSSSSPPAESSGHPSSLDEQPAAHPELVGITNRLANQPNPLAGYVLVPTGLKP